VGVIIGMDPHKRSATIEIVDERAGVLVTAAATQETPHEGSLAAHRARDPRPQRSAPGLPVPSG